MWRTSKQIELPRRVAAYYLLFGILAVLWLGCGFVWVAQTVFSAHVETGCIARVRRTAAAIGLDQQRAKQSQFQAAIEALQREQPLIYCALVGSEQQVLAHSDPSQVNSRFLPASGTSSTVDGIQRVQFTGPDGRPYCEYALPLRSSAGSWATLYCARSVPSLWGTARITARHASAATIGASFFVALGAVVVYRAVRPMAEIDRQLRHAAGAAALSEIVLYPVEVRSGSELGWNRLVDAGLGRTHQMPLRDRVAEAIAGRGEQRWDSVLNSITDGIVVTDGEGRIEFVNLTAAALLGKADAPESLQAQHLETLLELNAVTAPDSPLLDPDLCERQVADDFALPARSDQILRLQRTRLRTAQHAAAGHVWVLRDVTQLKLAEKMRDDFLSSATHELRTPLANIKAYAETLVLSEMTDVEQQKMFCNTINAEATRLSRVVDDLLNISSMEAGSLTLTKQEVDLERLLQETVTKTRPQMTQKNITFELVLPEKMPKLQLDKDKFAAAVVNLLGNAAKYTPAGGSVKMQVHIATDTARISIHDSGVGISAEELPMVFEKFFRSKDARVRKENGTGLGLSFTQEVVRLHGGRLEVQSELDKGSTFTIHVPLV